MVFLQLHSFKGTGRYYKKKKGKEWGAGREGTGVGEECGGKEKRGEKEKKEKEKNEKRKGRRKSNIYT